MGFLKHAAERVKTQDAVRCKGFFPAVCITDSHMTCQALCRHHEYRIRAVEQSEKLFGHVLPPLFFC